MASKKEKAFKLFDEGKKIGDPELVALDVKPRTLKKYLGEWKNLQAAPKPTGEEVELSSLGTLQLFMYQSHIYTKRRVLGVGIKALSRKGDILITLAPDTLVILVK